MELVYEKLIEQFSKEVDIEETLLIEGKGFYLEGTIFIDSRISEKEKVETLLEEWGHYKTTTRNILKLDDVWKSKEEQQAMDYAVKEFIPVQKIKEAYNKASYEKNDYEIAENLNITIYMLRKAYIYYKRKEVI